MYIYVYMYIYINELETGSKRNLRASIFSR